jgi:hypothetical protein
MMVKWTETRLFNSYFNIYFIVTNDFLNLIC